MKSAKYWLRAVSIDAALAALFIAWQFYGVDGAGSAFLFFAWALAVLGLLAGFAADKTDIEQRPPGFVWYHVATEVAFLFAMAWFGLMWLAACSMVAAILCEAARKREPKKKRGEVRENLSMIRGPAGCGKTTWLQNMRNIARDQGKRVAWWPGNGTFPGACAHIASVRPDVFIVDEVFSEGSLRELAKRFPDVKFFAVVRE